MSSIAPTAATWALTCPGSLFVDQVSSVHNAIGAGVMVFVLVVSTTEQPLVVMHFVLHVDGDTLHSTPQDEAVLVEHSELDSWFLSLGSLLGFGGGFGSFGPGKSVPGPQLMRHGSSQNKRQGFPQLIRHGGAGRGGPGLKVTTGS